MGILNTWELPSNLKKRQTCIFAGYYTTPKAEIIYSKVKKKLFFTAIFSSMKILLSRKESSTNDVTHTSLCHSTHIVFFPPFQQQHNLLLSWNEKFFNFTTLFSFVEQLFAQQQHQQRLKPAHLTAFTLRGFVHNWCHIIIVKTSQLFFVDYTTTTTRATRIFFSHFQSDAHTLLRLYAQLQHAKKNISKSFSFEMLLKLSSNSLLLLPAHLQRQQQHSKP